MLGTMRDAQALSALRLGNGNALAQQQHIHFCNPARDRKHVSDQTHQILRDAMRDAGIGDIWITSTVRDTSDQASTMLQNLKAENAWKAELAAETDPVRRQTLEAMITKKHVGYALPGTKVLNVASQGINAGQSDAQIIEQMIRKIDSVGLVNVTKHAAVSGRNTVDISVAAMMQKYHAKGYQAFVAAVRGRVAQGQIARFGWPEGPSGKGRLFHDGGCLHIEVEQGAPGLPLLEARLRRSRIA